IIFEDIYNTFFKDEAEEDEEAELAKDDKGKGKADDHQNRVDRVEKVKSKLMVYEKETKKASVWLMLLISASTASRGYMKIAMTGCVLSSRAFNDPNAPPPSTT
ncbi:hypothetical protein Tco_1171824, partial [Tanacetum coccineum]